MTPEQTAVLLMDMAKPVSDYDRRRRLEAILVEMAKLLDEGDQDDMWGTEGWRHYVGLED